MKNCIFCQIAMGKAPAHIVYEDDKYLAFLSIFPNTDGFTVVIPKKHYASYAFNVPEKVLTDLVLATKKVAQKLDAAFDDVGRTGMFFEGFGVDHLHSKLTPMHGTGNMSTWKKQVSGPDRNEFSNIYQGYISSHDSKRADDKHLASLAKKIRKSEAK